MKGEVREYSGQYVDFSVVAPGMVELVYPGNQRQKLKMRLLAASEEIPELLIVGDGDTAEIYYRTLVQEH